MPKQGLTEIVGVLDRSGSMESTADDAIGGFNSFLKEQKELPGEAKFSLVIFDNEYDVIHDGININDVPNLDRSTFVPRGSTALLDAIGRTINMVGDRLNKTPEDERPEKVIVSIVTDGGENASREFDRKTIHDMIAHQEDVYSWEFVFLAANQDAFAAGSSIGIKSANTYSYVASGVGTTQGYADLNRSVSSHRTSRPDKS